MRKRKLRGGFLKSFTKRKKTKKIFSTTRRRKKQAQNPYQHIADYQGKYINIPSEFDKLKKELNDIIEEKIKEESILKEKKNNRRNEIIYKSNNVNLLFVLLTEIYIAFIKNLFNKIKEILNEIKVDKIITKNELSSIKQLFDTADNSLLQQNIFDDDYEVFLKNKKYNSQNGKEEHSENVANFHNKLKSNVDKLGKFVEEVKKNARILFATRKNLFFKDYENIINNSIIPAERFDEQKKLNNPEDFQDSVDKIKEASAIIINLKKDIMEIIQDIEKNF